MYNTEEKELFWIFPKKSPELVTHFINEFHIHPVMAQVLASRGYRKKADIHNFLYAKLPNLIAPEKLEDMEKSTKRIHQAMKNNEHILIYGDNDVDGITGTTLLVEFLRSLGLKISFYLATRGSLKDNTILNALNYAKEQGCSMIITVDCGVTEAEEISLIAKENIDVIVTDHHEPTDRIPHCIATLNPKRLDSKYPNRDLTGVGVAFKLAHGMINYLLTNKLIPKELVDLKRYLDLVALGTISDMGSLKGENRILVRYGLEQIQKLPRIGLLKLMHVSEVNPEEVTTLDIASKVAPRLNSLGRISDPKKGVELLLLRDVQEAESLVVELDKINQKRQMIERRDSQVIEKLLETHPEALHHKAIILDSEKLHSGIIAIISTRIAKQYNRPSIIVTREGDICKGSIRTIHEYPVLDILKANAHLLENYGGHDFAAGFTILDKNFPEFRNNFIQAADQTLKSQDILPKLKLDARVSFKDLTFEFLEYLALLEPYGVENPFVILYAEAVQVLPPRNLGKTPHLKLYLEEGDRFLEGIAFNMKHRKEILNKHVNHTLLIAFTPHINVYLKKSSIQLHIRDFKVL